MKALKKITALALSLIMIGAAAVPVYADWETKNGKTYYQDENGENLTGWQTIDGKQYYFKKDGSLVTKSTTIDGIRYKFASDGVCQGKSTGWVKSKDKRFYYEDGVRLYGWVHIGEANKDGRWYFIDKEKGRLTGGQIIDGVKYNFSSNGKWDMTAANSDNGKSRYSVIDWLNSGKLDSKSYGGCFMLDEMLVIWSVDGKAEKAIKEKYPNIGGVVYRATEYSISEMKKIQDHLNSHPDICTSNYIDEINNRLVIGAADKQIDGLLAYLDTLPNKDCVRIVDETGVDFFDD